MVDQTGAVPSLGRGARDRVLGGGGVPCTRVRGPDALKGVRRPLRSSKRVGGAALRTVWNPMVVKAREIPNLIAKRDLDTCTWHVGSYFLLVDLKDASGSSAGRMVLV